MNFDNAIHDRSPDENVPMVSAEEIIDEQTDEEDVDVEEMSNEDSRETAPISSGESMYIIIHVRL
jgi:hypothetical protein